MRVRLALPLGERGEVDVVRRGGDLVVTVGSYRRVMALPGMLGRFSVTDARLEWGRLQVAFRLRDTALLPEIAGQDDAREGTG